MNDGLIFYLRHCDLGPSFLRLRLVCKSWCRAIQANYRIWPAVSALSKFPLAILSLVGTDTANPDQEIFNMKVLPTPKYILIGDKYIYMLRRKGSEMARNSIRIYQMALESRWKKVKRGEVDKKTAECKSLMNLIDYWRIREWKYGIFIEES